MSTKLLQYTEINGKAPGSMLGKKDLLRLHVDLYPMPLNAAEAELFLAFETLAVALASGYAVRIPGLGTFEPVRRKARLGRNPQSGEPVQIPEKHSVKFKAAKELTQ
ncbi:HU family DNA-binding protein [Plasticicumulans sp.]|uniref:HU family DNA-binding protein n=1 Tax=Plasticicumulans sp. TaxID=2307179 RepID=UPI0032200D96